jgi:phenylalanyl-tRNA synthetase beta chain
MKDMSILRVGVPAFRSRKDISIPEDIVEEVLRVYGYDNIPPVMPAVPVMPLHVEKSIKMEHKIRRVLTTAHRFLEVHNYIWFNDHWLKTLEYEPGETLVLKNPTSPETSRLRTTLIPNLLALIPKNRPFHRSFRLFEIGRRFYPCQEDESCEGDDIDCEGDDIDNRYEGTGLGGIAFQRAGSLEDFYLSVKSAVEDVLEACGVQDVKFREPPETHGLPWTSKGHFVMVYSGWDFIGYLGILDKSMTTKVCREGGQIVWFEIDCQSLSEEEIGSPHPSIEFEEPPTNPLSWQDFSLLWNIDNSFAGLESLLDCFENPLIVRWEFLDSYRGKGLDKGTACYSFRFWIGSPDHTLSGEEIELFHQQFLTYIKENNIALRT